jgi:prepilin-type N-terminal cleavage/methylation domain-containing protein
MCSGPATLNFRSEPLEHCGMKIRGYPDIRHRTAQRGVTLIELLIAVSLVAVISAGMLIATRTTLTAYQKTDQRLRANRQAMNVAGILNRQLASLMPAMGECPTSDGRVSPVPLFAGTPTALRAVTTFSVAEGSRGYPQIVEYLAAPSPSGGYRLIVNEHPFTGPSSSAPFCRDNQFLPVQITPASLVIADHLAYCRFSYHQPDNPRDPAADLGWLSEWTFPMFPPILRIDMAPLEGSASPLPFFSLTVPIRTDRLFTEQYGGP